MKRRLAVAFVALIFGLIVGAVVYRASIYLFGFCSLQVAGSLAFGAAVFLFSLYDRLGLVPVPPDDSVHLFPQDSEADGDSQADSDAERKVKR